MQHFKVVPEFVAERTVLDKTTCDICGENIRDSDMYDSSEVNLSAAIGSIFPDGDCRDHWKLDCCGTCFEEKVKPLIERHLAVKFRLLDKY